MERLKTIPWPRIFAEGTAIVVSILLAFAIEAWWEQRREEAVYRAQVETLLGEFRESRAWLDRQLESLEGAMAATATVLEIVGPDAGIESVDEVQAAIRDSLAIGVSSPHIGSLQGVLVARGDIDFIGDDTWTLLQRWPMVMNDLEVDSRHLERNRE